MTNVLIGSLIIIYIIDTIVNFIVSKSIEQQLDIMEEKIKELERKVENCGPWY
jgi:hypothetical protein